MSGLPVKLENLESFQNEWRSGYDKLHAEAGLDMLKLTETTAKLETELLQKYAVIENVALPKTQKQWSKLFKEYGPIVVTKAMDSGQLTLAIMDQQIV